MFDDAFDEIENESKDERLISLTERELMLIRLCLGLTLLKLNVSDEILFIYSSIKKKITKGKDVHRDKESEDEDKREAAIDPTNAI